MSEDLKDATKRNVDAGAGTSDHAEGGSKEAVGRGKETLGAATGNDPPEGREGEGPGGGQGPRSARRPQGRGAEPRRQGEGRRPRRPSRRKGLEATLRSTRERGGQPCPPPSWRRRLFERRDPSEPDSSMSMNEPSNPGDGTALPTPAQELIGLDKWRRLLTVTATLLALLALCAVMVTMGLAIHHTILLFALGGLAAYALEPLVSLVRRPRFGRNGRRIGASGAAFLVFGLLGLGFVGSVWWLGAQTAEQVRAFQKDAPEYRRRAIGPRARAGRQAPEAPGHRIQRGAHDPDPAARGADLRRARGQGGASPRRARRVQPPGIHRRAPHRAVLPHLRDGHEGARQRRPAAHHPRVRHPLGEGRRPYPGRLRAGASSCSRSSPARRRRPGCSPWASTCGSSSGRSWRWPRSSPCSAPTSARSPRSWRRSSAPRA